MQILQQAWPFVGQYLEKLLVETIAPAIRASSIHLQTLSFTKVNIGDKVDKWPVVKAAINPVNVPRPIKYSGTQGIDVGNKYVSQVMPGWYYKHKDDGFITAGDDLQVSLLFKVSLSLICFV